MNNKIYARVAPAFRTTIPSCQLLHGLRCYNVIPMATLAAKLSIINALLISNLVSIILFVMRVSATRSFNYWFLFWNLLLAWVPLFFVYLLRNQLKNKSWREPLPVIYTLLWLGFLPNSFYLMSDLIHLQSVQQARVLFDAVLFLSFIWNGMVAGLLSIIWVHQALLKRRGRAAAAGVIAVVLLLTSFAIYLGRNLRWNTWDVLVNPAGILFDVSERVINPFSHPQVLLTTLTFFMLIGSMYAVVWQFYRAFSRK